MNPLLFTKFETEVLEFELLNLAAARHGEFLDEEDVAGNLVARNFAGAELAHVEVGHLYAFVQNDEWSLFGFSLYVERFRIEWFFGLFKGCFLFATRCESCAGEEDGEEMFVDFHDLLIE